MAVSRRSLWGLVGLVLAVTLASQWWAHVSERRTGERLAALARPGDIQMLSSQTCPYCTVARRWMTERAVPFEECFIEQDAACQARFSALLARGTPMMVVRGQAQLGFDPGRVLARLEPPG